jgi:formylglycine-generating enzyme required for sulfatase activity
LVNVADFCIQKAEVTLADYQACVDARACLGAYRDVDDDRATPTTNRSALCSARHPEHPDSPMNCVDWRMADHYCRWLGGRLPTEQEWEYAARGTDARNYPWGNAAPDNQHVSGCLAGCAELLRQPIHKQDSLPGIDPGPEGGAFAPSLSVGKLPEGASPFGALNMADGVSEWTSTQWCNYEGKECFSDNTVLRGGCSASVRPNEFMSALRASAPLDFHGQCTGIRCVFSPDIITNTF